MQDGGNGHRTEGTVVGQRGWVWDGMGHQGMEDITVRQRGQADVRGVLPWDEEMEWRGPS